MFLYLKILNDVYLFLRNSQTIPIRKYLPYAGVHVWTSRSAVLVTEYDYCAIEIHMAKHRNNNFFIIEMF